MPEPGKATTPIGIADYGKLVGLLAKAFDGTGLRPKERLPVARELGETSIMWLVHPTLTADEMKKTADVTASVLHQASAV